MLRLISSTLTNRGSQVVLSSFKSLGAVSSYNFGKRIQTMYEHQYEQWLPRETDAPVNDRYVEKGEIQARVYKVLSEFEKVNLRQFSFAQSEFERDLKLDSLERTAMIVAIEHEFKTVFEDNVFDNFKSIDEIVTFLARDPMIL